MKFQGKTPRQLLRNFEDIEFAKAAKDWKWNWEPTMHEPFSGESHIAQYYPIVHQGQHVFYYTLTWMHEVGQYLIVLVKDVDLHVPEDVIARSIELWEDDPAFEGVLIQMIKAAKSPAFAIEKVD